MASGPLQGSPGLSREAPPPRAGSPGFQPPAPRSSAQPCGLGSGSRLPRAERLPGNGGQGGDAVFALELRASLTLSCLSLCRHVAAPAWASSPAPGHLGISGPRKGAGGGLCGNRPRLVLGTPRLRWPHRSRYSCRGLGLAALQALEPRHYFYPPGSRVRGAVGARFGIEVALRGPLSSIRQPWPFVPSSLLGLPSPWGSHSLFLSPGLLTPISSFSESVFPSPVDTPSFPGSRLLCAHRQSFPSCFFP